MSAATPPEAGGPTDSVPVRRDLALGAMAAVVSVMAAASTLFVSPAIFLTDDYATYFMPGFHEIARLIAHGQFPLITDRLWNGGALLQEYQYAVLNPVSLLLYVTTAQIGDLSAGAAVFSLVHIAILAAGTYALCRSLGCLPRHAFLAGAVAPLSDWIFFWGATDWIPALVSLAWLAWAWALLIVAWRRRAFAPAAALAVALTLLSGWPFADFALLVSVLVAARVLVVGGVGDRLRQAAWPALAILAGGLLAMPAILPLEIYAAFSGRPAVDGRWGTDLTGLLEFGMPFVQVRWGSFGAGGFETVRQPIVYAAWFAPLALAGANWRSLAADRRVWIVLGSALAFGALSMISHIGLLRWMFRLLPYYQLALIVMAALALTSADQEETAWKFDRLALVIAAETWLAFTQTRSLALAYLGLAYVFGALAWVSTRFGPRRDTRWTAMALATSVGVFGLTVWNLTRDGYPTYPQAWQVKLAAPPPISASATGSERLYVVHRADEKTDPGPAFWANYQVENTNLYQPGASIGGYSAMRNPGYDLLVCWLRATDRCSGVLVNALAPKAPTGRSLVDLMGVGEVNIERPDDAAVFAARAGDGWTRTALPGGGARFARSSREGQVTWATPGAAGVTRQSYPARVVIDARNDATRPGRLVIARAWYPAWRATLNGAPVRANPLDGALVAVDLPPASRGTLVLTFWPAGLTAGLVLAAIGALILALSALFQTPFERAVERLERRFARRGSGRIGAT